MCRLFDLLWKLIIRETGFSTRTMHAWLSEGEQQPPSFPSPSALGDLHRLLCRGAARLLGCGHELVDIIFREITSCYFSDPATRRSITWIAMHRNPSDRTSTVVRSVGQFLLMFLSFSSCIT